MRMPSIEDVFASLQQVAVVARCNVMQVPVVIVYDLC